MQSLSSKTRNWIQLLVGFGTFGVAVPLMIQSGLGLGPWDAFHVGLHNLTGLSIGMASIVVGLVILVVTSFLGIRPGLGTILNMVLIGLFIDLVLPWIPVAHHWSVAALYYAVALILFGYGTGMYIGAGLGSGPRDGMMVVLSRRSGWPAGRVRTVMELSVLGLGWLMGGKIGIGTLIFAVSVGPATQWGFSRFGLTPSGDIPQEV